MKDKVKTLFNWFGVFLQLSKSSRALKGGGVEMDTPVQMALRGGREKSQRKLQGRESRRVPSYPRKGGRRWVPATGLA